MFKKKIFKKIIPDLLMTIIIDIKYYAIFFLYFRNTTKRNIKLKNSTNSKRAFILATGPSIKKENLEVLNDEDCFSVSNFFLHEKINEINPKYHFFIPFHEPLIIDEYIQWLIKADNELPKSTKIVLGHTTKALVEDNNIFKNREVIYLFLGISNKKKYNIAYPICSPATGPQMIIPFLFYLGYKEIYLLGCDHTILRDYKKNYQHFYDNSKDVRSSASSYKGWSTILYELKSNIKVFELYEIYNKIASNNKIKIYNLSKDSWLDTFEFRDLNFVLKNQ